LKRKAYEIVSRARGYAAALLLVGVAGFAARELEQRFDLPDPGLLFLTSVLLSALLGGLGPSLVASVASSLAYNYYFVDPRYTLNVTQPQDVVSLMVFLIVAVLTSHLAARVGEQADTARRREARTAALYAFSRDLAAAADIDDLLPVIVAHLGGLFRTRAVLSMPSRKGLEVRAAYPHGTVLTEKEREAAQWAWAQSGAGDAAASMQPGEGWLHISLGTARGEAAVLSLDLPEARETLSGDQLMLLDAMSHQAALAIERCRIDAVLEDKAKTEQVIEASEDGIFVLDGDGLVVHVNEVACAILAMERAAVIDRPFDELASEQPHYLRLREVAREVAAAPERHAERVEITAFLRGRDHHYLLRTTPLRFRRESQPGLLLALQDVTYVREQESRRENLVATLSHELRSPLTSLRMAVELLRQRSTLSADQKALADAVYEDVLRIQDVAQEFLDLARTRAMAIGVQRRRFDVHELAARMLRLFTIQANEKGVTLELSEDLIPPMMGDETKLSWALSNLIGNAIRHTPPGGTVRIETGADNGAVLVSVKDSGPGIAAEDQDRIFERYTQAVGGGETGAVGLGLSIVRDIVQAHGGRIRLESALGKGTRFTLELPSE